MREIDEALVNMRDALRTHLNGRIAVYEADSGISLPRFESRHILIGTTALAGPPVNPLTIWCRVDEVRYNDDIVMPAPKGAYQDVEVNMAARVFMPQHGGGPEITERAAAMLSEAIRRVLEKRLTGSGKLWSLHFDYYQPQPDPISDNAARGITREFEIGFMARVRQQSYYLTE